MNPDDRRLIAESVAGQTESFGLLVLRYQDRLFNSVLRVLNSPEDAADAVQDAFINAYQNLHSFKGDSEFYTWLYRIAFNSAVTLRRKRRTMISLDQPSGSNPTRTATYDPPDPHGVVGPEHALEQQEQERILTSALAQLSLEHRTVLVLKDIDGLKYEDIAHSVGVPIGTVRSRIHRARAELKELLGPQFEITD